MTDVLGTFAAVPTFPRDFPLNLLPLARELRRRRVAGGRDEIWCLVRRRYVVTQPEELVRQAAIVYLQQLGYPVNLMQLERGVPRSRNRLDLLTLDRNGSSFALLEAKRPDVSHLEGVAQLSDYSRTVGAPYTMAVNGVRAICVHLDRQLETVTYLSSIPQFPR